MSAGKFEFGDFRGVSAFVRSTSADAQSVRDTQNKPLGFELKGIHHRHPYLAERGIDDARALRLHSFLSRLGILEVDQILHRLALADKHFIID